MVNLELYKLFVIVAKEENITKASNILNISQPAVTKHIKNLEEILKFKLFERTNKGLVFKNFRRIPCQIRVCKIKWFFVKLVDLRQYFKT